MKEKPIELLDNIPQKTLRLSSLRTEIAWLFFYF